MPLTSRGLSREATVWQQLGEFALDLLGQPQAIAACIPVLDKYSGVQ